MHPPGITSNAMDRLRQAAQDPPIWTIAPDLVRLASSNRQRIEPPRFGLIRPLATLLARGKFGPTYSAKAHVLAAHSTANQERVVLAILEALSRGDASTKTPAGKPLRVAHAEILNAPIAVMRQL